MACKTVHEKEAEIRRGNVRSADFEAAAYRLGQLIDDRSQPPVRFYLGEQSSDLLEWRKTEAGTEEITDFPEERPVRRTVRTAEYRTDGLLLTLHVTAYEGYPILEYDAVLKNISETYSQRIRDIRILDSAVSAAAGPVKLHAFRGVNYLETEYEPLDRTLTEGAESSASFAVKDGKPTGEFLPEFNAEIPSADGGVIAVLNWQGSWKAEFALEDGVLMLRAGQYRTDFVLTGNEAVRLPGILLLYYRGDHQSGQNIYRKWFKECCLMRESGRRLGPYLQCCLSGCSAKDVPAIETLGKSVIREYVTYTEQDACWYPCREDDWEIVGNWYEDLRKYPSGLREVSEASHRQGLPFCLWFEPERASRGTKTFEDLAPQGKIIRIRNGLRDEIIPDENGMPQLLSWDAEAGEDRYNLVNLAEEGVKEYLLEEIDRAVCAYSVDIYRQDFNLRPGPYWAAWDRKKSAELGIPRYGLTEEKHCSAMLWILKELLKRHPGMLMDLCASGGMRYDLESSRYGFLHTRTDWFARVDASQVHTWTLCGWCTVQGTGIHDGNSEYEIRSKTVPGLAVSIVTDPSVQVPEGIRFYTWYPTGYKAEKGGEAEVLGVYRKMLPFLKANREIASCSLYDEFYTLTEASFAPDARLAYQFHDQAKGGACFAYLRNGGSMTVRLKGLEEETEYFWETDETAGCASGEQLMKEGLLLEAGKKKAFFIRYRKSDL